jgi:hypothetical protein
VPTSKLSKLLGRLKEALRGTLLARIEQIPDEPRQTPALP